MPRVLRIINRFNLGGPSYNAAYLTKYLSPEYETLLIGGEKQKDEESSLFIFKELGIEPLVLPEMSRAVNFFDDLKAYRKIKKIIREFKPDIVHTHAAKAGALGRMAAFNCKVPVVVHTFHGHVFHSYFGKFKTTVYKLIERYLAKRSSAIIAISEKQKKELCEEHRIAPAEKIRVIPLGFDLTKFTVAQDEKRKLFRKEYSVEDDEICVVIIGRLVPVKNHSLFLRAVEQVKRNSQKKIRAFIVGDGQMRNELMNEATQLGIENCFWHDERKKCTLTFTSWIKDVSFPLAGSDIVCLTSFNEGTPVSLIEAQAAAKPIVSTITGGIENSVHPDSAFLVAVADEKLFAKQLGLLIENDVLRTKMSEKGRPFVLERFHYTRLTADMRSFYAGLLRR